MAGSRECLKNPSQRFASPNRCDGCNHITMKRRNVIRRHEWSWIGEYALTVDVNPLI